MGRRRSQDEGAGVIRVTVELVSARGEAHNEVLGCAVIANDGVRSQQTGGARGSYDVALSKRGAKVNEIWRCGKVKDFNRKRLGAWDLLYLALRATVGERNDDAFRNIDEEARNA